MGRDTKISWATHTANFWIGCIEYSAGCENCYARTLVTNRMGKGHLWGPEKRADRQIGQGVWRDVDAWNRDAKKAGQVELVFVGSLMDVFEDHHTPAAVRPRVWDVVRRSDYLHFLFVTKRAENIRAMLPDDWGQGYPNVWLITSIEDMRVAWRADELRAIPAVVRGVSYEPALGPLNDMPPRGLDWLIYGSESGKEGDRRPDDDQWARDIRYRCDAGGVPFFYKQGGSFFKPETRITLDGAIYHAWPTPRAVPLPPSYATMPAAFDPTVYAASKAAGDDGAVPADDAGVTPLPMV